MHDTSAKVAPKGMLVAIAAIAGFALYLTFTTLTGIFPRCPFHWLTGLSCPGCGGQRALMELIHLHPLEAWRLNLLLPPVVLYLLALVALPAIRRPWAGRIYAVLTSATAVWMLLAIVVLWWIIRNILDI